MLTSSCCRGSSDSDARKTNISPPWDRADRNTVHSDGHHNATGRVGAGAKGRRDRAVSGRNPGSLLPGLPFREHAMAVVLPSRARVVDRGTRRSPRARQAEFCELGRPVSLEERTHGNLRRGVEREHADEGIHHHASERATLSAGCRPHLRLGRLCRYAHPFSSNQAALKFPQVIRILSQAGVR